MDSSRTCDPDSSASRTRPARRRGGRTTGRRVCRPMLSMVHLKRDECIAYRQSLDGADVLTPPKALDAGRGDYFAVVMPGCTEPGRLTAQAFASSTAPQDACVSRCRRRTTASARRPDDGIEYWHVEWTIDEFRHRRLSLFAAAHYVSCAYVRACARACDDSARIHRARRAPGTASIADLACAGSRRIERAPAHRRTTRASRRKRSPRRAPTPGPAPRKRRARGLLNGTSHVDPH